MSDLFRDWGRPWSRAYIDASHSLIQARRGLPQSGSGQYPAPSNGREPVAELSQANPGLIRRDYGYIRKSRRALDALSISDLLQISAEALAERLSRATPRRADDPEAKLAAFADTSLAEKISARIDQDPITPGAEEVTSRYRDADRLARDGGCSYLLPTIMFCSNPEHPLANREFLFPFASVIEMPQSEIPDRIGPMLAVTAITEDEDFLEALLESPNVDRLNIGAIPTCQIAWD